MTQKATTATKVSREVRVETISPMRVAFFRFVGPYEACSPSFQKLMAWAAPKGLLTPQSKVLALCHDDPEVIAASELRMDCCITVGDSFEASDDVQVKTIEAGECVVLTHRGPYSGLKEAYGWLYGQWVSTSARELADSPSMEIYINDPADTAPSDLVTEICVSLKPQ